MFNIKNIQTNNTIVWADCTYEFSNVYTYTNMYVSKINVKQGYMGIAYGEKSEDDVIML